MAVQTKLDNTVVPFVLTGLAVSLENAVIIQDAGRVDPLLFGTVMAKIASSGKWTPFVNEAATDGTAIPQAIYIGPDITAAKLVAGDIADSKMLVGTNVIVAQDQIVIENSKTLDTVITVGTTDLRTVRDRLAARGIFVEETIAISGPTG